MPSDLNARDVAFDAPSDPEARFDECAADDRRISRTRRQEMERAIVEAVIDSALRAGCLVSVIGEEGPALMHSSDRAAILGAMFTSEHDCLVISRGRGRLLGWVYFVYGNEGWTVIGDNTSGVEGLLAAAEALAAQFEAEAA